MNRLPPIHVRRCSCWLAGVLAGLLLTPHAGAAERVELTSPNGQLRAIVALGNEDQLHWSLHRQDHTLITPSRLGITVGEHNLGADVALGEPAVREINETYPWRGVKTIATNHCRVYQIPVRHKPTVTSWNFEARVFNDGFAYRYRVPGTGSRTVKGESSSWTLPPESRVWFQTNTGSYEGPYRQAKTEAIPIELVTDQKPVPVRLGPPVTVELSEGGFLLLSEGALADYSGMTLQPTRSHRLDSVFEDDPQGFTLENEILSPWRVTVAVHDLNALVNTDVFHNLNNPPDPDLFPEGIRTSWIQPGRSLITWCVFGNDGGAWHLQKWFVDHCAALRCEYLLVDGGWQTERWGYLANGGDAWARLQEICQYAADRNVGIVVWHAYPEGRNDGPGLTDPEARRTFFRRCQAAGVSGVKIDFFDSERKAIIDVYRELARLAAEHQLTINFHGANKPTGEVRTWPNEITREGIREQEYLLWDQLPLEHYTALPFTRMVVGHSDFLPTYVRKKYLKNTTATFQMATAVIATSSFHSWPDHPDDYLVSPFLGLIQSVPLVWDETIVLPGSKIGHQAAFARRAGDTWYIAALNGTEQTVDWSVNLRFLGAGVYSGTLYQDGNPHPEGVTTETGRVLDRNATLQATLARGGGFVGWLKPKP